jgi:eukaryotic-like serine/threonine-protein kinase
MRFDNFDLRKQRLGHYEIKEFIGGGGNGIVYSAIDIDPLILEFSFAREVAIKFIRIPLPLDNTQDTREITLFKREVIAISHLSHPHILHVCDYGTTKWGDRKERYAYMVMPLCKGSLDKWLKAQAAPLSPKSVLYLLQQAADALELAHREKIVHQDVKPQNFLIQNNTLRSDLPHLLLADFGIVKLNTATVSIGNGLGGTPPYVAPEQWNDRNPLPASDQYSLAIMAYELLIKDKPPRDRHGNILPPSAIRRDLTPEVDAVILRALSKEPTARYGSVSEFAQKFEEAVKSSEKGEDIHMTLVLTQTEADAGTRCLLKVENEEVPILVPPRSREGPLIDLPRNGKSLDGRKRGNLKVTLAIRSEPDYLNLIGNNVSAELKRLAKDIDTISSQVSASSQKPNNLASNVVTQRRLTFFNLGTSLLLIFLIVAGSLTLFLTSQPDLSNIQATLNRIIAQKPPTPTPTPNPLIPTPTPNPDLVTYPPSTEQLVLNDSLNDSNPSNNVNNWNTKTDRNGGSCSFPSNGGYLAYEPVKSNGFKACSAYNTDFNNLAFEVTMTIVSGDCGGVLFRSNGANYYIFQVCANGAYFFSTGADQTSLTQGQLTEFNGNQANTIAVVANGENIDLYVNYVKITNVTDGTYTHQGQIGIIAISMSHSTQVQYTDAEVWTV